LVPHRRFTRSFLFWLCADWARKDETSRRQVAEMADDMFIASRCFRFKIPVAMTVLSDQELKSIKVPTLYLVGENEKIYSPQKAVGRLNRVAPHIETGIIPQAGHGFAIVQAEMVNGMVLEFLGQP
jgi:pimeloyl-ACP methyl ester carboxylesterase